jgi:hypothetical protein
MDKDDSQPLIPARREANRRRVRAWRAKNADKHQVALYFSRDTFNLLKDAARNENVSQSVIADRELKRALSNPEAPKGSGNVLIGGERIVGLIWANRRQAKPWQQGLIAIADAAEQFNHALRTLADEGNGSPEEIRQTIPDEILIAIHKIYDWTKS